MFYQGSLLAAGAAAVPEMLGPCERIELGHGAWLDWAPEWLEGSDAFFTTMRDDLPWRAHQRPMYERIVDVPRLICTFTSGEADVPDDLRRLAEVFAAAYGRPFPRIGANWYRSGRDSVALHPDKVSHPGDSVIAIVAVGERRPFLIRPWRPPEGSPVDGPTLTFEFGRGDLLVMGGTCQAFFEHGVPKTARDHSQRISLMFRG